MAGLEITELDSQVIDQLFDSGWSEDEKRWEPSADYQKQVDEQFSPQAQEHLENTRYTGAAARITKGLSREQAKIAFRDWIIRVTQAARNSEERVDTPGPPTTDFIQSYEFFPWTYGLRYNRRRTGDAEPPGSYLLWQEQQDAMGNPVLDGTGTPILEAISDLVNMPSGDAPIYVSIFRDQVSLGDITDVHWRGQKVGTEGAGQVSAEFAFPRSSTGIVGTDIVTDLTATISAITLTETAVAVALTAGSFTPDFTARARLCVEYKTQRLVVEADGQVSDTAALQAFVTAWLADPDKATTALQWAIVDGGADSAVVLDPSDPNYFDTRINPSVTPQIPWDRVIQVTLSQVDADGGNNRQLLALVPSGKEIGFWKPGLSGQENNAVAFRTLADPTFDDTVRTATFRVERLSVLDSGLPSNINPPTGKDFEVWLVAAQLEGYGREDTPTRQVIYRLAADFTVDMNTGAYIPTPPLAPTRPADQLTSGGYIPPDWTGDPTGTRLGMPYEWESRSIRPIDSEEWGGFSDPILYGTHPSGVAPPSGGTPGADGKGWEYVFVRTMTEAAPTQIMSTTAGRSTDGYLPAVPAGLTDRPFGQPTEDYPYEWGAVRKWDRTSQTWGEFSPWFIWRSDGADGKGWEYVFVRNADGTVPAQIMSTTAGQMMDDYVPAVPAGITDNPQGASAALPYEFAAVRKYDQSNQRWHEFFPWFLWTHFAPAGVDGRGRETVFLLNNDAIAPAAPQTTDLEDDVDDVVPAGWTDDPRGAREAQAFEWGSDRRTAPAGAARKWTKFGPPYLHHNWATDGVPGTEGIGVNSIVRDPATGLVTVVYDAVEWTCLVDNTGSPDTSYVHQGLPVGAVHAYRVRARTANQISLPSNADSAMTPAAASEGLRGFAASAGQPTARFGKIEVR